MKIYFAGLAGGGFKGEQNLINKFSFLNRLFSYFYCRNNEFGNMDILNLWIEKEILNN